jgi:hypothetical protein
MILRAFFFTMPAGQFFLSSINCKPVIFRGERLSLTVILTHTKNQDTKIDGKRYSFIAVN